MKRRKLFGFLSVALGIVVPLVAAEIALRVLGIGYGGARVDSDPVFHHVHPKNYSFVSFSPVGEWNGGRYYFDEDGLVAKQGQPRDDGAPCRIAFLGDSFTEAVEVPYEASFVSRLSARSRCQIRNYGVGGYSPVLYLLQWQKIVRDFKPDLVLVQLYSNDIADDQNYSKLARYDDKGRVVAVPGPDADILLWLARRSNLAILVRGAARQIVWRIGNWGHALPVVGGYVEEFPDITPFSSNVMQQLNGEIMKDGGKPVLFAIPSKYRLANRNAGPGFPEYSDKWKAWAAENNIQFLDLVKPFHDSVEEGRKPFFPWDIHINAVGHEIAARTICSGLPEYFSPPCG